MQKCITNITNERTVSKTLVPQNLEINVLSVSSLSITYLGKKTARDRFPRSHRGKIRELT